MFLSVNLNFCNIQIECSTQYQRADDFPLARAARVSAVGSAPCISSRGMTDGQQAQLQSGWAAVKLAPTPRLPAPDRHLPALWFAGLANQLFWWTYAKAMWRSFTSACCCSSITFKATAKGGSKVPPSPRQLLSSRPTWDGCSNWQRLWP